MKKYTLFSFVFVFSFILLGFNVNSASADASGCLAGDLFSRTTGQACTTTTVRTDCNGGDLFSSLTGQPCSTAPQGDGYAGISGGATTVGTFNNLLSSQKVGGSVAVKALQQFLKDQGYYFGKIDGKYGKISARAVSDFQGDNNLVTTVTLPVTPITGTCANGAPNYPHCNSDQNSPVISGVNGPQSLNINQEGTWIVTASAPNGGNLGYSVRWGDENTNQYGHGIPEMSFSARQSATFTHSYSQAGNYTPVFTVTNTNNQSAQTSLSVNVGNVVTQPSITVFSPNGGETLVVGQPSTITWKTTGFSPSDTVYISLYDSSKYCASNMTGCWTTYSIASTKNTGSYSWDTNTYYGDGGPNNPIHLSGGVSNGAVYKIKLNIVGSNSVTATDSSDNNFTISTMTKPSATITVLSPQGGETWTKGTTQTIRWQDNGTSSCQGSTCNSPAYDIKLLQYSSPCTASVCPMYVIAPYTIARNISGSSSSWSVGQVLPTACPTWGCGSPTVAVPDGSYAIQVCQTSSTNCDSSNSFQITSGIVTQPSITVLSPNGGEVFAQNATITGSFATNLPVGTNYEIDLVSAGGTSDSKMATGSVISADRQTFNSGIPYGALPGNMYKIRVSKTGDCGGSIICVQDLSDNYFTITAPQTVNHSPVINSFTGPASLTVGQAGSFTASASDPDGNTVNYGFNWGDGTTVTSSPNQTSGNVTTSHTFNSPGTFNVTVAVSDMQYNVTKMITVTVSAVAQNPTVTVTSPNGGETFVQGQQNRISWNGPTSLSQPYTNIGLQGPTGDNTFIGFIYGNSWLSGGSYSWDAKQVCSGFSNNVGTGCFAVTPGSYRIVVQLGDGSIRDLSNSPFTITASTPTTLGLSASAISAFSSFAPGCSSATQAYSITTGKPCK